MLTFYGGSYYSLLFNQKKNRKKIEGLLKDSWKIMENSGTNGVKILFKESNKVKEIIKRLQEIQSKNNIRYLTFNVQSKK